MYLKPFSRGVKKQLTFDGGKEDPAVGSGSKTKNMVDWKRR